MDGNWFEFIAIQGQQARKAFYIIMVPLSVVSKFFKFNDESLPTTMRAQRILNKARVPQISKYIVDNPNDYILSSLCACVDGEVVFEPNEISNNLGKLKISMDATVLINDGQHRRAAIEEAVKQRPHLGQETISVVIYADEGLIRSQQMFSDLNIHAVKPPQSIKLVYNHREPQAQITKAVIENIELFKNFTDFEKSSLSNRTTKLFTFSSLHGATKELLKGLSDEIDQEAHTQIATAYWNKVIEHIPGWRNLLNGYVSAAELRQTYIHAHGVTLQALALVGNILLKHYPDNWKDKLSNLTQVNWSRNELTIWYGRVLNNGKINKSRNNIILASNYILSMLNVPLPAEFQLIENNYLESVRASYTSKEELV